MRSTVLSFLLLSLWGGAAALAGLAGAAALLWWGFRHKKPEAA